MPHAAKKVTTVRKKDWALKKFREKKVLNASPTSTPTPATNSIKRKEKGIPRGTQNYL